VTTVGVPAKGLDVREEDEDSRADPGLVPIGTGARIG